MHFFFQQDIEHRVIGGHTPYPADFREIQPDDIAVVCGIDQQDVLPAPSLHDQSHWPGVLLDECPSVEIA